MSDSTRYYHSPATDNRVTRRYSAGARLIGTTLHIAYAVCSEDEDRFLKSEARQLLDYRLDTQQTSQIELRDDQLAKWGQAFLKFAKHNYPITCLPKKQCWMDYHAMRGVLRSEQPDLELPTSPAFFFINDPQPVDRKEFEGRIQQVLLKAQEKLGFRNTITD